MPFWVSCYLGILHLPQYCLLIPLHLCLSYQFRDELELFSLVLMKHGREHSQIPGTNFNTEIAGMNVLGWLQSCSFTVNDWGWFRLHVLIHSHLWLCYIFRFSWCGLMFCDVWCDRKCVFLRLVCVCVSHSLSEKLINSHCYLCLRTFSCMLQNDSFFTL